MAEFNFYCGFKITDLDRGSRCMFVFQSRMIHQSCILHRRVVELDYHMPGFSRFLLLHKSLGIVTMCSILPSHH